jgi:hypothetical protein
MTAIFHQLSSELISARREDVLQAYNSARATNHMLFLEGNDKATAEYIFPNQMEDANNIVDNLYRNKRRVVSIQKETKVGADGLMIEIATRLTTHPDDNFAVNPENIRIFTDMMGDDDMINKAPICFKDKIFHYGELSREELLNIRNGLFIIDEIDMCDKEYEELHTALKEAYVLNGNHMEEHNNRFIFISSATRAEELYGRYMWGQLYELCKTTPY